MRDGESRGRRYNVRATRRWHGLLFRMELSLALVGFLLCMLVFLPVTAVRCYIAHPPPAAPASTKPDAASPVATPEMQQTVPASESEKTTVPKNNMRPSPEAEAPVAELRATRKEAEEKKHEETAPKRQYRAPKGQQDLAFDKKIVPSIGCDDATETKQPSSRRRWRPRTSMKLGSRARTMSANEDVSTSSSEASPPASTGIASSLPVSDSAESLAAPAPTKDAKSPLVPEAQGPRKESEVASVAAPKAFDGEEGPAAPKQADEPSASAASNAQEPSTPDPNPAPTTPQNLEDTPKAEVDPPLVDMDPPSALEASKSDNSSKGTLVGSRRGREGSRSKAPTGDERVFKAWLEKVQAATAAEALKRRLKNAYKVEKYEPTKKEIQEAPTRKIVPKTDMMDIDGDALIQWLTEMIGTLNIYSVDGSVDVEMTDAEELQSKPSPPPPSLPEEKATAADDMELEATGPTTPAPNADDTGKMHCEQSPPSYLPPTTSPDFSAAQIDVAPTKDVEVDMQASDQQQNPSAIQPPAESSGTDSSTMDAQPTPPPGQFASPKGFSLNQFPAKSGYSIQTQGDSREGIPRRRNKPTAEEEAKPLYDFENSGFAQVAAEAAKKAEELAKKATEQAASTAAGPQNGLSSNGATTMASSGPASTTPAPALVQPQASSSAQASQSSALSNNAATGNTANGTSPSPPQPAPGQQQPSKKRPATETEQQQPSKKRPGTETETASALQKAGQTTNAPPTTTPSSSGNQAVRPQKAASGPSAGQVASASESNSSAGSSKRPEKLTDPLKKRLVIELGVQEAKEIIAIWAKCTEQWMDYIWRCVHAQVDNERLRARHQNRATDDVLIEQMKEAGWRAVCSDERCCTALDHVSSDASGDVKANGDNSHGASTILQFLEKTNKMSPKMCEDIVKDILVRKPLERWTDLMAEGEKFAADKLPLTDDEMMFAEVGAGLRRLSDFVGKMVSTSDSSDATGASGTTGGAGGSQPRPSSPAAGPSTNGSSSAFGSASSAGPSTSSSTSTPGPSGSSNTATSNFTPSDDAESEASSDWAQPTEHLKNGLGPKLSLEGAVAKIKEWAEMTESKLDMIETTAMKKVVNERHRATMDHQVRDPQFMEFLQQRGWSQVFNNQSHMNAVDYMAKKTTGTGADNSRGAATVLDFLRACKTSSPSAYNKIVSRTFKKGGNVVLVNEWCDVLQDGAEFAARLGADPTGLFRRALDTMGDLLDLLNE